MHKSFQAILLLITLVTFVFVLRDSHGSPGTFLRQQITRVLQQAKPSDTLCKGINPHAGFSATQRNHAEDYRNSLNHIRSKNELISFIEGPEPANKFGNDYLVQLYPVAVPWIVFFAVGLLALVLFFINWCCTYCSFCTVMECCTHPKNARLTGCYLVASIVFMTAIIATGIAGIVVSKGIPIDGRKAVCSATLMIETIIDGSESDHWVGIRPAADKLLVVLGSFDSTVDSLVETGNSFVTINAELKNVTDAVTAMYNDDKDLIVATRPNPQAGGSYQPTYIQSLGPESNLSTVTGSLQMEMNIKKWLVANASEAINSAIKELKNNKSVIGKGIQTGRSLANTVLDSTSEVLQKVQSIGVQANYITSTIGSGLIGVFVAKMLIAILALTSILLVCFGLKFMNKLIHFSWCALGFLMLLGWILSTVALPLTLFLFEGCETTDKVINEPAFFNQTFDKFIGSDTKNTQEAKDTLYRCLYGNGDILGQFQVKDNLAQFNQIFTYLDYTSNLTEYVQVVPDSIVIPIHEAFISEFDKGYLPDAALVVEDLITLNYLSNKNYYKCTQMMDTWVLNSINCTASYGTVFSSGDAPDFNINSPTCIGMDIWGSKDISQRYNANTFPEQYCGSVGNTFTNLYLQNFVDRFVASRGEVDTVFKKLGTSLGDITTKNKLFMNSVKNITQSFVPIINSTRVIYNALANTTDGLFANSNCSFVRESLFDIRDNMCVGFISSLYQTTVAMIFISFMAFFGTFSLFCLAKKFLARLEKGRVNPAESG